MNDLTAMPAQYVAGNSLTYTVTLPDYPASQYTLTLWLAGGSTPTKLSKAASASGDSFVVHLSGGDTEGGLLPAGVYVWVHRLTKSGVAVDVERGTVNVLPNIAVAGASAFQSDIERQLAIVEAACEGRLTEGMESFIIHGRSVTLIPMSQLWKIRGQLRAQLKRIRNGGEPIARRVRFGGN